MNYQMWPSARACRWQLLNVLVDEFIRIILQINLGTLSTYWHPGIFVGNCVHDRRRVSAMRVVPFMLVSDTDHAQDQTLVGDYDVLDA